MDSLPRVLENVLETLLHDHVVSSWKITADGLAPTIVLRLKPTCESQENGYSGPKHFRAKPPSQIERDRKRMCEYRQRLNKNKDEITKSDPKRVLPNVNQGKSNSCAFISKNDKCKASEKTSVKETVSTCDMLSDSGSESVCDLIQRQETAECTAKAECTGGALDTGPCEGAECDPPFDLDSVQLNESFGQSVLERSPRATRDKHVNLRRRGRNQGNRVDSDDKKGGCGKTITNEMDKRYLSPTPPNDYCLNISKECRGLFSPSEVQQIIDALNGSLPR